MNDDQITSMMRTIHQESISSEVIDSGTENDVEETETTEEMRKRERRECIKWLNMYGKKYISPTPKYLLIKDVGRREFSREDVIKRTAWLGMTLGVRNKEQIPVMRRMAIKGQQCISIAVNDPVLSKKTSNSDQNWSMSCRSH